MFSISATKLRSHLFDFLKKVSSGEVISIELNGKEVARLVPTQKSDWRKKMTLQPKLNLPVEEVFAPLTDIWKDYI